jgi:hypothetical protein
MTNKQISNIEPFPCEECICRPVCMNKYWYHITRKCPQIRERFKTLLEKHTNNVSGKAVLANIASLKNIKMTALRGEDSRGNIHIHLGSISSDVWNDMCDRFKIDAEDCKDDFLMILTLENESMRGDAEVVSSRHFLKKGPIYMFRNHEKRYYEGFFVSLAVTPDFDHVLIGYGPFQKEGKNV